MFGHYLEDGQTRPAFVAGIDRLYPETRFEFRPCLAKERAITAKAVNEATASDAEEIAAALIGNKVIKWDAKRDNGEVVPLEVAHILKVHPALTNRIYLIVLGHVAPDADPLEAGTVPDSDKAQKEFHAMLAGQPSPTLTQAGREKN